jgi:hypothetical protein
VIGLSAGGLAALRDPRLLLHAAAWAVVAALAFGLVSAIIPNPVFGRSVAPEPFAIWTWILSAPLTGLVLATYTAPVPATPVLPIAQAALAPPAVDSAADAAPVSAADAAVTPVSAAERRSTTMASLAGLGAFLAIGCPVCNKVALVLLGAGGAMSVYAPIQPWIAAGSLGLFVVTAAWRLRLRARGGACAAPARTAGSA